MKSQAVKILLPPTSDGIEIHLKSLKMLKGIGPKTWLPLPKGYDLPVENMLNLSARPNEKCFTVYRFAPYYIEVPIFMDNVFALDMLGL